MVYNNKFVMCVLVNGKICQELANGTVPIPFGSEYELRFRNKNSRRAIVKFSIDGEDVSDGGYVIPANGFIDIKRYASNPKKFKFVSLDSAEAIDFGKNGPNHDKMKGTVEARFFLEREYQYVPQVAQPRMWSGILRGSAPLNRGYIGGGFVSNSAWSDTDCDSLDLNASTSYSCSAPGANMDSVPTSAAVSLQGLSFCAQPSVNLKDGATVEGDHSNQRFSSIHIDYDEAQYTTVKLFLQGYDPAEGAFPDAPVSSKPIKRTIVVTEVVVETKPKSVYEAEAEVRRLKDQIAKEKKRREDGIRKMALEAEAEHLRKELAELIEDSK